LSEGQQHICDTCSIAHSYIRQQPSFSEAIFYDNKWPCNMVRCSSLACCTQTPAV